MTLALPATLYERIETLTIDYGAITDPATAGFDLLDVPFPKENCIGYPEIHARFRDMRLTGYRRYCGFLQLIQREETRTGQGTVLTELQIDTDPYSARIGNPYFSCGYPASLYDAPCRNLGGCDTLLWRAYSYLVEMPSRMNGNRIAYAAGFTWGYVENKSGVTRLLDLEPLGKAQFEEHRAFLLRKVPDLR